MVLPLIGGMLGAGLAGAGMMGLGGMSPLLAGALGSGLGSLAQGDDFGEAIATGLGSYFGGKFLGPMLGKAGIGMNPSTAVTMSQGVPAFELGSAVAAPSLLSSALSSNAIGAGAAGLLSRELNKPPVEFKSEIKKSNIPQAEPANRVAKFPSANYMPGFDPEFNYFEAIGTQLTLTLGMAATPADDIITPQNLLNFAEVWKREGVKIIGGCCGLGPEHTSILNRLK